MLEPPTPVSGMNSTEPRQSDECRLLDQLRATPEIFQLIAESTNAERANQRRLRELYSDHLVRAALAIHDARGRAAGLLPDAEQLWLTRTGLEQSTAWEVARHKAQRFRQDPADAERMIFDLCCGIGVDAAAFAQHGPVTAVDLDPAMCLRAQWNCEIWQPESPLVTRVADVSSVPWDGQFVYADPDRRAGRARPVLRLEQYAPDLHWMQHLTNTASGGAIKLGPASNFMQKFPDCEIELISLHGECREATVWFGSLRGPHPFRATVLPSGATIAGNPLDAFADRADQCGDWIYDPDPAVVRSGMLEPVAERLNLARLDADEEYLTGSSVSSDFVVGFQVEVVLPNNLKDLKRWLRKDASSDYEIKCRRIPTDAAAVRKQLPLGDAAPRVIFFARISGKSRIVIARRFENAGR